MDSKQTDAPSIHEIKDESYCLGESFHFHQFGEEIFMPVGIKLKNLDGKLASRKVIAYVKVESVSLEEEEMETSKNWENLTVDEFESLVKQVMQKQEITREEAIVIIKKK
jgi:hypothetical protein